ncbi:hypothetical protein BDB01DRAFT_780136 [Pilobolus umbonatus]|nr:hypothetical protein BDB01DRAFT_780136 [Pilobolus umbonatus]
MNISALNAPATPPYDYHNHPLLADKHQNMHTSYNSAFRPVSLVSIPSPPEIILYSEDDEEDQPKLVRNQHNLVRNQHNLVRNQPNSVRNQPNSVRNQPNSVSNQPNPVRKSTRRKTTPHRSPSYPLDTKSIVFQLELDNNNHMNTKVILGRTESSLLWSVRKRVSLARNKNRLLAPLSQRSVRALRIQIPRPQFSTKDTYYDPVSPITSSSSYADISDVTSPMLTNAIITNDRHNPIPQSSQIKYMKLNKVALNEIEEFIDIPSSNDKKKTSRRSHSTHTSSGRPSRVKGPCQACNETSDGCMRKAFNWPFPTSTLFNDKGKPFVYLCNKCGLRYNKSGGCVCRHCRWVLCKEEKRKAMQLIEQMRLSRPGGKVDPNENIENFLCTPKYWSCACPWKVGWVLHSQHDDDEDDIEHPQSPSNDML